jgi:hypothetical protein
MDGMQVVKVGGHNKHTDGPTRERKDVDRGEQL